MTSSPAPGPVRLREIVGWAMFDFANSSYTTVIVTVAFGVYYTSFVAPPGRGELLWGTGLFVGNLIVLLFSPVVGAIADDSGRKKLFLFATYATCVAGTAALWLVVPGRHELGLALLVVSFVGFSFGENLTAAFLPEISTPKTIGRISGFGWGLGYLGGLAALGVVALMNVKLGAKGLSPAELARLRLVWPATAAFFLVAALPTFLFLRERAPRGTGTAWHYVRAGFGRIAATTRSIRQFAELARFLLIFLVYSCGLTTIIAFAGIFASQSLGFTFVELMWLFGALQLSAAGGAFFFGWIEDRLGAITTIRITLVLWILVSVGVYFCHDKVLFWGIALASGLGIGSLQSSSRGLVGLFSPPEKSGEFFGFWGLAGKAGYMLGPFLFGAIAAATGSQRLAMLSTAVFFLAGLAGMATVDEHRGRAAVERWQAEHAAPSRGTAAGAPGAEPAGPAGAADAPLA